MNYFRIKNWKKHQHYSDRRPPWIKLHNSLFDDYEFTSLPDESRHHLIMIWLLASRATEYIDSNLLARCYKEKNEAREPILPEDENYLTRQAGLKKKISLKPLFSAGFLVRYQDASKTLATCSPETEAYRSIKEETETETEANPPRKKRAKCVLAASPSAVKIYDYYCQEIRNEPTSKARALKNIDKHLGNGETPELLWECINNYLDDIQRKKTEERYRQVCGNFFGIDNPGYIGYRDKAKKEVEEHYDKKTV